MDTSTISSACRSYGASVSSPGLTFAVAAVDETVETGAYSVAFRVDVGHYRLGPYPSPDVFALTWLHPLKGRSGVPQSLRNTR